MSLFMRECGGLSGIRNLDSGTAKARSEVRRLDRDLMPREEEFFGITRGVSIPKNVKVSISDRAIELEGPLGALKRSFKLLWYHTVQE
jgi:hypothetical protein